MKWSQRVPVVVAALVIVTLVAAAAAFFAPRAAVNSSRDELLQATQDRISDTVRGRAYYLRDEGDMVGVHDDGDVAEFVRWAHVRAADENSIISVQWIRRTPSGKVQLVPARDVGPGQSGTAPNEALLDPSDSANALLADAAHQPVAEAAINTASIQKQVAISGPVKLASGDAGFYMAVPVEGHTYSGDIAKVESQSAMVGLIDAQILVADALSAREPLNDSLELQQYGAIGAVAAPASEARIVNNGQLLASIGGDPQNPVSGSINVAGQMWEITIGGGSLSAVYTALPWLVLGIGLALTVMVGQAITQARRRRDAALLLANERLQELMHRATHDQLTGLPNRALFLQLLSGAVERSKADGSQIAVLFIDLDRFKEINDNLGHDVGDQLLVEIAERLLVVTRGEDAVARFGGDEFTILIDKLSSESVAIGLTQRLKEAIAIPFNLNGTHVVISASVGIAIGPDDASVAAERMLHDADLAMYDAKDLGAGFKLFDHSVSDKAVSYFRIESDLRGGLERNELTVFYQPVIELATGAIVGVEALARWDRPGLGVFLAEEFIVPAERSGLIVPIGRYVLDQACAQLGEWQRMRHAGAGDSAPIWLSVNLSAPELLQDDLLRAVVAALDASGLEPSSLMVEITERFFVNVKGSSAPPLNALRDLGVRLSIDDFGIAYSSLAYVKHLSVDQLKIDSAFVQDLGADPRSSAIVNAVIEMARSLGIAVVAEGIETPDQLKALQMLNCELGQGFLIGEPQPAAAITALIVAGHTWNDSVQDPAKYKSV